MGWSRVEVGGQEVNSTGPGMLVLLGIAGPDEEGDARYMAVKTASLRIFGDSEGKMNFSGIWPFPYFLWCYTAFFTEIRCGMK